MGGPVLRYLAAAKDARVEQEGPAPTGDQFSPLLASAALPRRSLSSPPRN